jgi:hypothetical protein
VSQLPARLSEFARQRGTASAFLFERLAMLHYAPRQISSHGSGLLRDGSEVGDLLDNCAQSLFTCSHRNPH